MSGLALIMVLAAAFFHAGWNYLAKKSRKKLVFIWWFLLVAMALYLPMFSYFFPGNPIPPQGWACIATTGVLHFLYFWFLGGAYERGDLSLVYPISRGSGPLFVPFLAVLFLQEHLSVLGVTGIALIVAGIYMTHLKSFSPKSFAEPFLCLREGGTVWALCTGGTIALYSLVDKAGVQFVSPPVYIYLMVVITWLLLTPVVLSTNRRHILLEWQENRGTILIVGLLVLGTYLTILFALQMAKVSYVVAVREVSIVFSVLYGILRLGEKHGMQKILGASLIATGVVCIGLTS
ncbi:MAG: DMT family transporter [Desulfohalobiaceae bacterium]|nr:DMT family transporter [Desulfohalobiaceae bacterium]